MTAPDPARPVLEIRQARGWAPERLGAKSGAVRRWTGNVAALGRPLP